MATAILKEIFEIELIRTRDLEVLRDLDIVYDVGGGEFDHHGLEKVYRENRTPYAACGLIWREFGKRVIKFKDQTLSEGEVESIFNYVDRVLIEGIDAIDNGIRPDDEEIIMMNISLVISGFNPQWHSDKSEDEAFNEAVELSSSVLKNTIDRKLSVIKARDIVKIAYENRKNPKILVLDTFCPWGETINYIDEKDEVLFVVYPNKGNYAMYSVRGKDGEDKKKLPKSWAGLRDEELAAVTGVEDSVFCHTGRFIAVAGSFEGIMKLAELAINEKEDKKDKEDKKFSKEKGLLSIIKKIFNKKQ